MPARICTRCGYDLTGLASVCPECAWPSELYTDNARAAMAAANQWAIDTANGGTPFMPIQRYRLFHEIRPVHLALGIVQGPAGVARHVLDRCGASGEDLAAGLLQLCPLIIAKNRSPEPRLVLTRHTKALAGRLATQGAEQAGHTWIGTEHLLLAILLRGPGKVIRCFADHNARFDTVRDAVIRNNARHTPK